MVALRTEQEAYSLPSETEIRFLDLIERLQDDPEARDLVAQLRRQYAETLNLATSDALTGIGNRQHYERVMEREIARAERYERPLTLLLIDPDYFKHINDTYGHGAGDTVLRGIAQILKNNVRTDVDEVCRYGGDEFIVVLPETDLTGARMVAEKLRQMVEAAEIPYNDRMLKVTISIGVSVWTQRTQEANLKTQADNALYASKHSGRNKVSIYQSPTENEPVTPDERKAAESLIRHPHKIEELLRALLSGDSVAAEREGIALGLFPADPDERVALMETLLAQAKKAQGKERAA